MKLIEAVSLRVKKLLLEKGVSQYYLFKNGGIPRSTISELINLKKKNVSIDTIYQICSTLEITLVEFFDDELFDFDNIID